MNFQLNCTGSTHPMPAETSLSLHDEATTTEQFFIELFQVIISMLTFNDFFSCFSCFLFHRRFYDPGKWNQFSFSINVAHHFVFKGGDSTGTGRGGNSIYGKEFADEVHPDLRHSGAGI